MQNENFDAVDARILSGGESHSFELELSVVSCMIACPEYIDLVCNEVDAKDFADRSIGLLFESVASLHNSGKPVGDTKWLFGELMQKKVLSKGGEGSGMELTPLDIVKSLNTAVPANGRYYASLVRQYAIIRDLEIMSIRLRQKIISRESTQRVTDWIRAETDRISNRFDSKTKTMREHGLELVNEISQSMKRKSFASHETGMYSVDKMIGGLLGGELIIIGARPSNGKTSLVMQWLSHIAQSGKRALMISLEMKGRDLACREIAAGANIKFKDITSGRIDENDLAMMALHAEKLSMNIPVFDDGKISAKQIRSICKIEQASYGLDVVAIDHLRLVKPDDPRKQRVDQVEEIVASLKALANEINCPVILLSQLNRSAATERPKISHLGLSGSIEQDADAVILIHNPPDGGGSDTCEFLIEKQRNGATGVIKMRFNREETKFEEV